MLSRNIVRLPGPFKSAAGLPAMVALLLAIGAFSGCRYWRFNYRGANVHAADVIIVPGQELLDDGRGTWILWNRLLMGKLMLDDGYAPRMIVSGGKPKAGVTEAAKMAEFAGRMGMDPCVLHLEPSAFTSVQNAHYSAEIMVRNGWRSALVVTDPFHIFYAIPVFQDAFRSRGLTLYWAPVDYDRIRATGLSRNKENPPDPP